MSDKQKDNGGVYFVPAFTGLACPYWDPYAKGTVWAIHCRHFMRQQAQRNTVRRHLSAVAEIRRFLISLRVWGRRIFL